MQPGMSRDRRRVVIGGFVLLGLMLLAVALVAVPQILVRQRLARAEQALANRQYDLALDWLNKAARVGPRPYRIDLVFARTYRELNDLDTAARHLADAADRGLPQPVLDLELKMSLARSGKMQDVKPYMVPLLDTAGDDCGPLYKNCTIGYLLQMRFAESAEMLDNWQKYASPQDPWPAVYRGHIWLAQFEWQKAADAYRTAIQLDEGISAAQFGLGKALLESGSPNEAEEPLQACARLDPDHLLARTALANCLIKRGAYDEADRVLQEAAELNSQSDEVRVARAQLAYEQTEYQRALDELTPFLEKWPEDRVGNELYAAILEALGRSDEAAEARREAEKAAKALEQLPGLLKMAAEAPTPESRYQMGLLLLKHGPQSEGAEWVEAALRLNSAMTDARRTLIEYYEHIGNRKLAKRHSELIHVLPH